MDADAASPAAPATPQVDPAAAAAATADSVRFEPGAIVDGWRLGEMLHRGGMATLWSVTRTPEAPWPDGLPQDLPLLMKVPRIKRGEDPTTIVGFEVECMLMPNLRGPHVPRFVAKGDFTTQPYLVMERIDGPSLKPRFDAAPLPLEEAIELIARIALAVHDLHRQDALHLDLKPSNVVMRPDGTAVLIDFGLSRHQRLPDLLAEQFRLPMGTGPYMSPEQVQYQRDDLRSDVFALGVMLYQFTTGVRPFGAPTNIAGLRRRLYVDPEPPRKLRPDCPPWLQEVILRCLEVKPDRRYQTAAQLAMALQAPDQIPLTKRAQRLRARGWWSRLQRRIATFGHEPKELRGASQQTLLRSPIVVVAVDTEAAEEGLLEALREHVLRTLTALPDARLACVTVLKTARVGMDEKVDSQGRSLHVQRLVRLKHWARPMTEQAPKTQAQWTYHVLEAPDPASAIVEFAQRCGSDLIVLGARGHSQMRRYLGSVSAEVAASAGCSVMVVRVSATA